MQKVTRSEVQLKRPPGASSRGVGVGVGGEGRAQGPSQRKLLVEEQVLEQLGTGCQRRDLRPDLQEPSYRER